MGTNIDELIEDISNNKLSNEESSMVDSILPLKCSVIWFVSKEHKDKMKNLDKFQKVLESLKKEGKYRVLNSILRERGKYPNAIWADQWLHFDSSNYGHLHSFLLYLPKVY